MMVAVALLLFPKLALGLSGFETGVAVMPLISGDGEDDAAKLRAADRERAEAAEDRGAHHERAAHGQRRRQRHDDPRECRCSRRPGQRTRAGLSDAPRPGQLVGHARTTSRRSPSSGSPAPRRWQACSIWCRAICPATAWRPDWARATRPLVLLITVIAFIVTVIFDADVNKQGGAYATGVLMLMTSAAVAVTIALPKQRAWFLPITIVFVYTTIMNIFERPEGLKIATWFIVTIVVSSLISRVVRSTELRMEGVDYDETAAHFIGDSAGRGAVRILAIRPNTGQAAEYARKLEEAKRAHHLPENDPIALSRSAPGRRVGFLQRAPRGGRRRRRLSRPALFEPRHSQRDRRFAARSPRPDRQHSARLFRVDRRQPDHVSA